MAISPRFSITTLWLKEPPVHMQPTQHEYAQSRRSKPAGECATQANPKEPPQPPAAATEIGTHIKRDG